MQDHPGAPGTARKGITRTVVPTACGGVSAPKAPGPDHARSRARHTRAPGHGRPLAALSAARHDRPRATPRAPGADVPPATTAGAPGQHRLSAVPSALDHARSGARHQRAPGHDRPSVTPSGAAEHDRPRATLRAPGHDVPLVTVAGAPGYGRPRAARIVPDRQRSHHAPMARPGHALASAGTSVPITTASLPARVSRLLPERLASTTATPNTRFYPQSLQDTPDNRTPYSHASTYPQSHRLDLHSRRLNRHSRVRGNPRPHVTTAGPQAHQCRFSCGAADQHRYSAPSLEGRGRRLGPNYSLFQDTTHPIHPPLKAPTAARRPPLTAAGVHPATQAPTRPSPTTATGVSRQPPSRAPPPPVPPPQRGGHRGAGACQVRPHPLPWSLLRGRARVGARG